MLKAARWTAKNQAGETAGWAGDGTATIEGFDESRPGFGVEGERRLGPAVLLKFTNGLTEWVPTNEVEAEQEEAA